MLVTVNPIPEDRGGVQMPHLIFKFTTRPYYFDILFTVLDPPTAWQKSLKNKNNKNKIQFNILRQIFC